MIPRILEAVGARTEAAEAWTATDQTVSVTSGASGPAVAESESFRAHLRVRVEGRLGTAARRDDGVVALADEAIASARLGPSWRLHLPAPSPAAAVTTAWPSAMALDAADLMTMARLLRDRLEGRGREVETWAERSAGRVHVGNSAGVLLGYEVTLVGLGATVRVTAATGELTLRLHHAAASPPSSAELDTLVATVERWLRPPEGEPVVAGSRCVLFGPRAVRALLVPLRNALHADHLFEGPGPLAGRLGQRVAAECFTLVDDPLVAGRPGSRPVDDEGVICRRQAMVDRGVLRGWLADLITAERLGLPASGQAWRTAPGAPQAGWSNVVVEPGDLPEEQLAARAGDGILIEDLPPPSGLAVDGRLALTTPWAFRLRDGEPIERLPPVRLRGNVYEWLNRIEAVSAASRWWGAACLPSLLVDGVELT
jgi:PmbA protein